MTLNAFKKKEKKERKMNNIYFRFDNNYSTRFFYKQHFFSTQPHCCLTFSWSELQMLLRCWLTLSWRKPLLYRNQCIDLQSKSMDWFLYDNGLPHERVNAWTHHHTETLFIFTISVAISRSRSMSYLCDLFFIFIFIFIMINCMNADTLVLLLICQDIPYYFWMIKWMRNVNNLQ